MKIYNPSNKAITDVKIFGVSYSIDAEGTLENVPENVARYWQENLHKFLQIKKDSLELKGSEDIIIPKKEEKEIVVEIKEDETLETANVEKTEEKEVVTETPKSVKKSKEVK